MNYIDHIEKTAKFKIDLDFAKESAKDAAKDAVSHFSGKKLKALKASGTATKDQLDYAKFMTHGGRILAGEGVALAGLAAYKAKKSNDKKKAQKEIIEKKAMEKIAKRMPIQTPKGEFAIPRGWEAPNYDHNIWTGGEDFVDQADWRRQRAIPNNYVRIGDRYDDTTEHLYADPKTQDLYRDNIENAMWNGSILPASHSPLAKLRPEDVDQLYSSDDDLDRYNKLREAGITDEKAFRNLSNEQLDNVMPFEPLPQRERFKNTGKAVKGAGMGAAIGGGVGAMYGAFGGPKGAMIGGGLGAGLGAFAGQKLSRMSNPITNKDIRKNNKSDLRYEFDRGLENQRFLDQYNE